MRRTLEETLEVMAGAGCLLTLQRRAILEFLHSSPGHWTADGLFRALRPRYPSLARATVYKTLEVLSACGEIRPLRLAGDATHYDTVSEDHHHFVCDRCGAIVDVPLRCPIRARGKVEGHRVERCAAVFMGVCQACLASG